jgi:polar amino acid transport system substrate-binding protein
MTIGRPVRIAVVGVVGLMLVVSLPLTFVSQTGAQPKPFSPGSGFLSSAGSLRRVVADIAPTGKLRVALNMGNSTLVSKDPATGALRGVVPELGRALAESLKVPFAPVEYPGIPSIVTAMKANAWDIAFLTIDAGRAGDMDMSAAYMNVNTTYLVPSGSRIKSISDADQAGVRISVQRGGAIDIYLTDALKQAQLVRADTIPGAFELVRTGQADAIAQEVPGLLLLQERLSGSQVLPGRFAFVRQAIGLPKGHPAGVAYVRAFVEQAKASGMVKQAIDHGGLRGVEVAPPAADTSLLVPQTPAQRRCAPRVAFAPITDLNDYDG